jgi:hypothetical protein
MLHLYKEVAYRCWSGLGALAASLVARAWFASGARALERMKPNMGLTGVICSANVQFSKDPIEPKALRLNPDQRQMHVTKPVSLETKSLIQLAFFDTRRGR